MKAKFSWKRLFITLLVIFSIPAGCGLAYKAQDEKLTVEAKSFFTLDPNLEPEMKATGEFLRSVKVDKVIDFNGSVCSREDASKADIESAIKEWDQFLKDNPAYLDTAMKMISFNRLVFNRYDLGKVMYEINTARYIVKVYEIHLCYLKKSGKAEELKEGWNKLIQLSLNTVTTPNHFLAILIFSGIASTGLEKLKKIPGNKNIKQYKEIIDSLDKATLVRALKQIDSVTFMNTIEHGLDGLKIDMEYLISKISNAIIHINKMKNKLARTAISGEVVLLKEVNNKLFPITPERVEDFYEQMFYSRIADSEKRLETRLVQLKSQVQ